MALVEWSTKDGITRLTLARPAALNAMSWAMAGEFKAACKDIAKERSKVVVLSGEGPAFSAGGDLAFIEENRALSEMVLRKRMVAFYSSFLAVRELPQVSIARLHGAAVGAGLCLALACDLRAVQAKTRLALNFVRLGLSPGMAAWPLARALFGEARAKRLLFEGLSFSGAELHAWGGASVLADTEAELLSRTEALALQLRGHSWDALRLLKEETRLDVLDAHLAFEAKGQAACFKGPDIVEGVSAVRERREPRFRAR